MKPIRVYSKDLSFLTETDNYLSLQFMPRFYEVGEFELHINQYVEGAEYFVKGNLIVLDKREDKAMLIRHREIALDQNGKITENWRVTGVTLEGVLVQRATIPPADTSHDRKSGNAETVMKHYVENHFVNPVDPDRKIDFIEIAENKNRGAHVEWESRYKNVSDELTAISKQANLGWVMYADMERGKWIFDVVEPRDVTQDNEAGLQPVFFSPDFSTIKTQQFVDSDLNYKNVAYVGGQGEGVERKIVKVGKSEGIDLHEVFIDARDVSEEDEETEEDLPPEEYEQLLIERGQRRMREFETTFYLEAQILTPSINRNNDFAMSTPFEYETDFRLGDVVEVFNKKWNITMNAPITEFKEIHEPGGFILEAVFGEAQPTLINKIKREFDDLKGVEQQELPARLAVERMREAMEYGDERLSEEERARIEQALEILDESKEYAGEEAYQAEQSAKEHADNQDIVYDEEAKRDASDKSDQAREDAEKHAEDQDEIVKDEASQDATDKANEAERVAKEHADDQDDIVRDDAAKDASDKADRAEDNAKGHADDRADEAEQNANDYTDENAVDWEAYNAKMQEIGDDLADKVGVEYVDGQLQLKADGDTVDTLEGIVDGLNDTAAGLIDAVDDQEGRIVTVETDLDTVEGNLNLVISEIEDIDGIITQHGIDIGANAEAISFKASQDEVDTISGDVSSISGELSVLAGEVEAKAESSTVESLEGDVTQVSRDLSSLSVNVEGIEGNVSSLTQTVSDHGTEISDLETARIQHADLIEDRVTKTEYSTDQDDIIQEFEHIESFRQQHEGWINDRVTSITFHALEGRVETAEGQINTQAGLIEAKAESSVVDDLGESVTGALFRIDGLEGEITAKVEADDVRSIFTQEAGSFTFDADQINFDGHVFGQDATFAGELQAAKGTFEGDMVAGSINIDTAIQVGNEIRLGKPGTVDDRSFIFGDDIMILSGRDGNLRFFANQIDIDSELERLNFVEEKSSFLVNGPAALTLNVNNFNLPGNLKLPNGYDLDDGLEIGDQHVISQGGSSRDFTVFGNKANGRNPFRVYSHTNGNLDRSEFEIRNDGSIVSPQSYANESTNPANLRMGSAAVIYRSTSARRNKLVEEPIKVDPYLILDIEVKDWYDKANTEEYSRLLTKQDHGENVFFNGVTDVVRIPGIVSEDVVDVGLGQFVEHDENGVVQSVMYDRLWTLLIPITDDHNEKLILHNEQLIIHDNKLNDLDSRVEKLEKGVA
ncbi:hypothetical protein ACDX78_10250 [Virgibacillus oceani]